MDETLDELRAWAEKFATSRTGEFGEHNLAAEQVLGLLDTDQIGYPAPEVAE